MEINDPYYAGRIWGEMFSHVRKGDISLPGNGSLSTDSYGLVMKQVERGLAGKPGRGVKKLDLPDEDLYQYRVLNNMGHKNNTFSMPEEMWGRVKEEGLLAYNGTLGAKSFKNGGEANEYLKNVVENHVDPYLKKHGMPPARMVSADDFSDALKVEFPYPFIEKLRKGGKLPFRLNKKRKKGMSTSRR